MLAAATKNFSQRWSQHLQQARALASTRRVNGWDPAAPKEEGEMSNAKSEKKKCAQSLNIAPLPAHMDLGEDFYERLFDKQDIKTRRAKNSAFYPPKDVFLKVIYYFNLTIAL